ncbi:BLUF domain-containing protein [Maribacter aestuarii]|uniref:BLUF domain-containing protein n=1 Tax=Maribacter aestuarii TaxID=1130723 RepID=UPI00248C7A85|nr:BLUF domain-containing protein [Maribacter aestuarii]
MFSLIYRSTAKPDFYQMDLRTMMERSRINNKKNNITGCLLHHNNNFVQLLEGEEKVVRRLFGKIAKDERHKDIVLLNLEENLYPLFSKFSMVYNNLDDLSDQIRDKRLLFDQIFHDSEMVKSPGSSKLALWVQVNKLLEGEGQLRYG